MSTPLLAARHGRVLLPTLNRPDKLNALSAELIRSLVRALDDANSDDTVGAIVLIGQGDRAFTVGMDLKEGCLAATARNRADLG